MPSRTLAPRHRARRSARRILAVLVVLTVATGGLVGVQLGALPASEAQAAGSGRLTAQSGTCEGSATGRCRATIEWRTSAYGPTASGETSIPRRTLFSVYLKPGESLDLGSSSLGGGSGSTGEGSSDIVVWNPGSIADPQEASVPAPDWRCTATRGGDTSVGYIGTRAKEVAGASSADGTANPDGYRPCVFSVPSGGTGGIYDVAFWGQQGGASDQQAGGTTGVIDPSPNSFPRFSTAVSAWDLTVRPTGASNGPSTDIPGRVFTYVFTGFTGANPRPTYLSMYLNTLDGYRYAVDTKGFDPNGFAFYGNDSGFLDADGTTPLDHDVVSAATGTGTLPSLVGGTHFAAPQYPLSFEPLAAETLRALGIPTNPIAPVLNSISYSGTHNGDSSYQGRGGTFTLSTGTAGVYEIVISKDGSSYDPGDPADRVLRGHAPAGTSTVRWDGLDNSRSAMPPSATSYPVQAMLRGGEYHAPMLDVESSVKGGPSITLVNPPGSTCPFTGAASTGTNCTRAFYDDRGYVTSSGTSVGVAGGSLCPAGSAAFLGATPSPDHADVTGGFDSAGTDRSYGEYGNDNKNVACPAAGQPQTTFGDAKGLDVWTYFPSATRSTSLRVLATPARPTAADDSATTPAGTPLVVDAPGVLANDGGSGLTAGGASAPAHGTVTLNADGSYRYVPDAGFSGPDSFTYTATDDDGQTATATARITVTPTARPDSGSSSAGSTLSVPAASGVLANDTGSGLVAVLDTSTTHGSLTLSSDGSYRYTPDPGFSGSDVFRYHARDSAGQSTAVVEVRLTVAPVAVDDSVTVPFETSTSVTASDGVLANDEGSGLTARGPIVSPSHGSVSMSSDGSYAYAPADGYSGTDSFTYRATDSAGSTSDATVHVTVTPRAVDDAYSTPFDTELDVAAAGVLGNDGGQGLTVAGVVAQPAHGTVTLHGDGSFSYRPQVGYAGSDSFRYRLRDAAGSTAEAVARVDVAPLGADDAYRTGAGQRLTVPAPGVLANDGGSRTTAELASDPRHGEARLSSDGAFDYTPDDGFSGTDSFTYRATDGDGQSSVNTVTVTVVPVAVDDAATVPAGDGTSTEAAHGVLVNDRGSSLTASLDAAPQHGTVALAADGSYTYTPDAGFSGADSFTYLVTDADGQTAVGTVRLTVDPVARDDSAHTTAGTAVRSAPPGVLANDTGTRLTSAVAAGPSHGTLSLASDGSYVYTPADGFSGIDSFTYVATDSSGGVSAPATVTIAVAPSAVDDAARMSSGTTLSVPAATGLLANDVGSALTTSGPVDGPSHGTVDVAPDGSFHYTPDAGYSGPDSFTYVATDSSVLTGTATAAITVRPSARADSYATSADTVLAVDAPGVLGNDLGSSLVVDHVARDAAHGTLDLAQDGSFRYTPEAGYTGPDGFVYVIRDAAGQVTSATVSIDVRPTGQDDAYSTAADSRLDVPAPGVLANDAGTGLTASATSDPQHGSLALDPSGAFVYVPADGFSGLDRFTYRATDDQGQSADQTVFLTVAPIARADALTARAGTTTDVQAADGLLANDTGAGLTASGPTSGPLHGMVVLRPDGSYSYTPADGYSGPDAFYYVATDAAGQARTARAGITVVPVAADDAGTTTADTPLVAASPGVLTDDRGAGIAARLVRAPEHGTVALAADGSYTYVPEADYSGPDSFDYRVVDAHGTASDVASVVLTVLPVATADSVQTRAGQPVAVDAAHGVLVDDRGRQLVASGPVRPPAHGRVDLGTDGSYVYTPDSGYSGPDSFAYRATDASGGVADGVVSVLVTPVAVDDTASTPYGTVLRSDTRGVLANDLGSALAVTGITVSPAHGTAAVASDGTWTYTPETGYSGPDAFSYRIRDAAGTTADATVRIAVGLAALPDSYTTPAATLLVVGAPGVLADDGGSRLAVAGSTSPAHGTLEQAADGSFRYRPDGGFSGTDSYRYTIADDTGGTATTTVTIVVTPTAAPHAYSAPANRPYDVPGPGLLTGSIATGGTVVATSAPRHGTVTASPDGAFRYTPAAGFSGTDSFTYTLRDGEGRLATATVTMTVPAPASTIAASDETEQGIGGAPIVFDPVRKDAPGEGLTLDPGSVVVIDPATGAASRHVGVPGTGTWDVGSDGRVTFTPAAGYHGTAVIAYRVSNSVGQTATARLIALVFASVPAALAHTGLDLTRLGMLAAALLLAGAASTAAGAGRLRLAGLRRRSGPPRGRRSTWIV